MSKVQRQHFGRAGEKWQAAQQPGETGAILQRWKAEWQHMLHFVVVISGYQLQLAGGEIQDRNGSFFFLPHPAITKRTVIEM